jgi:hypothetical protein
MEKTEKDWFNIIGTTVVGIACFVMGYLEKNLDIAPLWFAVGYGMSVLTKILKNNTTN